MIPAQRTRSVPAWTATGVRHHQAKVARSLALLVALRLPSYNPDEVRTELAACRAELAVWRDCADHARMAGAAARAQHLEGLLLADEATGDAATDEIERPAAS